MKIYPPSAAEKLGLDVIWERLESYTLSNLGLSRLKNIRPAGNLVWLRAELARVAELQDAFRFDDPVPLNNVLDVRDVVQRAAPEGAMVAPEDLLAVRLVLTTLRRLQAYFENRREKYPNLSEAAGRITPLPDLEAQIERVVDDEGNLRDDASPELRRIRRAIVQQEARLREVLQQELRRAIGQGHATEDQPTMRNGRMVIPIRAEARRKVQGFVQDVSATGQTVYVEPAACLDLNNEVRELHSEERREIERILREVTSGLRRHVEELGENLRVLALFDLLQAKARLSNELDAVVPELNDAGIIDIRNGRNPVLVLRFEHLKGENDERREVVPLDLTLGEDFRTLVITGPNAGGKTVAMKTVGLFAIMLAYGLPIPVDPLSRFSLFQRLMVDIGDQQSMEEDLSTFSSHVANMKRMMEMADESTLILIDEAGTGTDPAEGGALAQAVLERLTELGARTIATTHHGTLKAFAHETEGIENGSMQFDQTTLSPTYRFRLRVPGSSYAFEIAERIGLPKAVLKRASELAGSEKTRLEDLIATFEARNQELETRLQEAGKMLDEASKERALYEERLSSFREERDRIQREALLEAQRIIEQANAQVERTIREIKEAQAEREATRLARTELERLRHDIEKRRKKVDQKRQVRRKAGARTESGEGQPARAGAIQVGDQVVLDGGSTVAEVLEIDGNDVAVAFDSMRMRVKLDRLQKVGGPRRQKVSIRHVQPATGSSLSVLTARSSIDLRGKRVDEALAEVAHLLDDAVAHNLQRVEILHGKGTGALRQSIHEYLSSHPDVASFEDAPWEQGGPGVTIVNLK